MELNLSYLILRKHCSPKSRVVGTHEQAQQVPVDLSFLSTECNTCEQAACFSLHRAQKTVFLFGYDEHDWTGYAFSDQGATESFCSKVEVVHDNEGEIEDDDTDEEDEDEMPNADLFASGGSCQVLDLGKTIWDPRMYFLRTASIRVDDMHDENHYLIKTLEAAVDHWVS